MQHIIYSHSYQWHKMKQIHSFICMLESDRNHSASHQSTQCNTHQSMQHPPVNKVQLSVVGAATSIFCCHKTKHVFCHNMFVTTNIFLSQQNFCHDKCNFGKVATNVFVATKQIFCCDKKYAKVLSRQKYFVATNIILS